MHIASTLAGERLTAQTWLATAQVAASFATVAALLIAVLQWRAAAGQLKVMTVQLEQERERAAEDRDIAAAQMASISAGERARNAFELLHYLERPDNLKARLAVARMPEKPISDWSEQERRACDDACRVWQVAAFWDHLGVLPDGFLQAGYGNTIARDWLRLEPLVQDIRQRTGDPEQRVHFERAAQQYMQSRPLH